MPLPRPVVSSITESVREMFQDRQRSRNLTPCLLLVFACLGSVAAVDRASANTFDGVYKGTQRAILTNNSAACARIDGAAVLRIENNHFTRRWGIANLSVDVAADGSFEAQQFVGSGHATGDPRIVRIISISQSNGLRVGMMMTS